MHPLFRFLLGLLVLLGLGSAQAASTITSQKDGRTCISSSSINLGGIPLPGFTLPVVGGSLSVPLCSAGSSGQKFEFTSGGAIVALNGKCLLVPAGGGKAGDQPTLADCGNTDRQTWRYEANLLKNVRYGWCLAAGELARPTLTLAQCAYNGNQKWTIDGGVASNWPQAASSTKPSAVVSGSSLTFTQMLNTIAWIQDETTISNTPFCWKKPGYDRGIGIAPVQCSGGKNNEAGLCYDPPRSGYGCTATTCSENCPSGYSSSGALTCHYTGGGTTYTKKSHARPIDGCQRSRFQCAGLCYDREDDGQHCRTNYAMDACGICSYKGKWDVTRHTYSRAAGTVPQGCLSNRGKEDGLCYLSARTGYTCTATICTQQCASGSTPCGAGCAQNTGTCVAGIVDMVVSPAIMLASLATEGAAGAAANGVRAAVVTAKKAAELGQTAAQLADILKNSIENYMAAAENDLAAISTAKVQAAVAAKYTKGSANYKQIAREYAVLQIMASVADMFVQLDILAITTADVSGISGTVAAFSKPPCEQHKSIP